MRKECTFSVNRAAATPATYKVQPGGWDFPEVCAECILEQTKLEYSLRIPGEGCKELYDPGLRRASARVIFPNSNSLDSTVFN